MQIYMQRNLNFLNVKDFGARGDGMTDDTAAITAAINAANSAGGGGVFFPAGTFVSGTQLLYSNVHLFGAGFEATVLQLKAGANADLLQGSINGYGATLVNIGSAFQSGLNGGVANWSVQNMTLDGNTNNQTGGPSWCIRVYGLGYVLSNVHIKHGYSGGIYSDWNGTSPPITGNMEAQLINVKVYETGAAGGTGIKWGGPHDSHFTNVFSFRHAGNCFHIGPNAIAMLCTNCHGYSPGQGVNACAFLIEANSTQCVNCMAEGSDIMQVAWASAYNAWIGGQIFSPTANSNGLQIGQAAGATPYFEQAKQSAGVTTAYPATDCNVYTEFIGCTASLGSIYFANSGGFNTINAMCNQSAGSTTTGPRSNSDTFTIQQHGLTPDGTIAKGGGAQLGIDNAAALGITDGPGGSGSFFNVNTFSKLFELPRGMKLRQYSDGFTTRTVELSGGTISLLQSTIAAVIANAGTITTSGVGIARVAPTGAVTGIILQAGTLAGQIVIVRNESAFTVTFDVVATSHVADGATSPIAANTSRMFEWNSVGAVWSRIG